MKCCTVPLLSAPPLRTVLRLRVTPSAALSPSASFLLSLWLLPHALDAGCHSGTCQPQTITAIKGLPLLGSSSCWEEPAEEGDALQREVSQHGVRLMGLVSIIREGDFEEIIMWRS